MLRDILHRRIFGPSPAEQVLRAEMRQIQGDRAMTRDILRRWYDISLRLAAQSDEMRELRRETEAALGLKQGPR